MTTHWPNIISAPTPPPKDPFPWDVFICIRLTSAFSSPSFSLQQREKTKWKKKERGQADGVSETDRKRCVHFFLFLPCPRDKASFFYAQLPELFLTETRFPFMRTELGRVILTGIEEGQKALTESPLRLNQQLYPMHVCQTFLWRSQTGKHPIYEHFLIDFPGSSATEMPVISITSSCFQTDWIFPFTFIFHRCIFPYLHVRLNWSSTCQTFTKFTVITARSFQV